MGRTWSPRPDHPTVEVPLSFPRDVDMPPPASDAGGVEIVLPGD
jgi:hypothetical protein